ncbi:MAG: hypothetical protein AAFP19_01900, partial [Bacteroidota bacterium]
MRVAIELSLYPLDENYGEAVIDYIERLRAYDNVEIVTKQLGAHSIGDDFYIKRLRAYDNVEI